MPRSPLVRIGLDLHDQAVSAHLDYVLAYEERALEACRGRLLNRKGMTLGVRGEDLFTGPGNYARRQAYASEELRDYLEDFPFTDLATWLDLWAANVNSALEGMNL